MADGYYKKIAQELHKDVSLTIHLKRHNKGGKRSKFDVRLKVIAPTQLFETQERTINYLSKQIKRIDDEMERIIKNDKELKDQFNLITSIKGVGTQTALFMISYTSAFTKLKMHGNSHHIVGLLHFLIHQGPV